MLFWVEQAFVGREEIRTPLKSPAWEARSNSESAEEGDFEVVYSRTCMTRSGRSVRDRDWCVWIYEAGVILIVIRLNLICTSINRGLISYRLPILLLRLDNYALFYIFSYL